MKDIRILFVGDIVGEAGLAVFTKHIESLRKKYKADAIIVNGENIAKNGRGLLPAHMVQLKDLGVNVVTSGNHVWAKQQIVPYMESHTDLLRPANYPGGAPGRGATTFAIDGATIGVINLQGRVFFRELTDCPFRALQTQLSYLKTQTNIIIIDFHAEATAEKLGLALFVDGEVSALVGTHTHVQTADERVLPGGTAYISDVGMVGALNSMIGFKKESALRAMLSQLPARFEVDYEGPFVLGAAIITIDIQTGKATDIKRIRVVDDELKIKEEK